MKLPNEPIPVDQWKVDIICAHATAFEEAAKAAKEEAKEADIEMKVIVSAQRQEQVNAMAALAESLELKVSQVSRIWRQHVPF